MNYYNENDPKAAAWLRELIKAGHIPQGEVDERSIEDVYPADLAPFTQCHFFAGIGGWSYALKLAGFPRDRSVWTGSCPCQPFSAAGKGDGFTDERHLWPAWFHLIEQCRPSVVFGEQVASKDGLKWFDLVSADLEGAGYAVGAADLCAAGVGAPHIRQRLYFVADSRHEQWRRRPSETSNGRNPTRFELERLRAFGKIENSLGSPGIWHRILAASASGHPRTERQQRSGKHGLLAQSSGVEPMANAASEQAGISGQPRITRGASPWSNADWIDCLDSKQRAVEPGTFPLAHGVSDRVGLLRGYGNAIVPQVAQAFIEAYLDASV